MGVSLNIVSSVACNSTIASSKQRQEQNKFNQYLKRKTQGSPQVLQKHPIFEKPKPNNNGQSSH